MTEDKEIAIVYMLAGLSSRFEGNPKWLIKIGPNGESLIEYSLNQALPTGFTKIIFIVSEKTKPLFKEAFGNSYRGIPIIYALQSFNNAERDKPWGTVDALCSAKDFIDCPFVICNGDDIYGREAFERLTNHLKENNLSATLGYKLGTVLPEKGQVNRGIFETNPVGTVKSIIETFGISTSNLEEKGLKKETPCSMNIFALFPKDLEFINEELTKFKEKNKRDRKIECLLPEKIGKLIKEGKITMQLYPTDAKWLGVTNPEDEEKVRKEITGLDNRE